jgi:hypothetical protein
VGDVDGHDDAAAATDVLEAGVISSAARDETERDGQRGQYSQATSPVDAVAPRERSGPTSSPGKRF